MKKFLAIFMTLAMLVGTFAMLPTFADDSVAGWDGKTAYRPEGSGTENDPFLIASAENFYWIQQNTADPQNNAAYGKLRECPPSFQGMYFEQVCDIDFNGKTMKSIGGYARDTGFAYDENKIVNGLYIGGFGGTYNGNGYALKNLNVIGIAENCSNEYWPVGLFAAVWGATLKNMVLDNVDVNSTTPLSGILVGKAMAPAAYSTTLDANGVPTSDWALREGYDNFEFNLIENITIKDNCDLNAVVSNKYTKITSIGQGINAGTIVARAMGTTIRNCYSEGNVTVTIGATCVGGILGQVGQSVIVENCIYNGDILINKAPDFLVDNVTCEIGFGGIAGGSAAGTYNGTNWGLRAACTGHEIRNCVFGGTMVFGEGAKHSGSETHIGGIMGGINTLNIASNSTKEHPYIIEGCINAGTIDYSKMSFKGRRTGGILGSGWCAGSAKAGTLYIKDCLSLDVAQTKYVGTNEFRCQTNATSAGLQHVVPLGLNAQVLGENDTYTAYAAKANVDKTLATFTATTDKVFELVNGTYVRSATVTVQDKIDAIEAEIEKAMTKGTTSVVALGYQEATAGGAYRMILGTHSIRHAGYGIVASLTVDGAAADMTPDRQSHVAYTAVLGYVADETAEGGLKQVTYTAKELGVEYLTTLTISDIAATGTSVYTFRPYTYEDDGTRTYGDTIVMTFVDGVFSSAVVNPQ